MADVTPTPWRRQSSELHADCRIFHILREQWDNPELQASGDFFVMHVGDWAVTLARTGNGRFVLVRQFRFGSAAFSWELPAGLVDPGEDPAAAAARELYEESGYIGDTPELLGVVHPNPAIQRNRCHVFLISDARRVGPGRPDPHESFEVRELEGAALREWVAAGRITHAIVPAALFLLGDRLEA